MPRIRTIKPEFWTDDKVIEISITARMFFIGLWSFADDNGVVENKPRQLKARIFPADNIEVEPLIQELARQKMIVMYQAAGQSYLMVTNFRKHHISFNACVLAQRAVANLEPGSINLAAIINNTKGV